MGSNSANSAIELFLYILGVLMSIFLPKVWTKFIIILHKPSNKVHLEMTLLHWMSPVWY